MLLQTFPQIFFSYLAKILTSSNLPLLLSELICANMQISQYVSSPCTLLPFSSVSVHCANPASHDPSGRLNPRPNFDPISKHSFMFPTVNGSDVYMNSCLYGNGTSFVESLFDGFGEKKCDFKSSKCIIF